MSEKYIETKLDNKNYKNQGFVVVEGYAHFSEL